ncbi:hypothetical protein GGF31_006563 [Allomyces arbusculus]|nr:hypothetical protein GGF31_006563 [Allomyces arbusculus]
MPGSFASPSRTPPRLRAPLHADCASTSRPAAPQAADPDRLRDDARARRLFESHRPSLDAAYADLLRAHGTDPYFLHRILALLAKCDSHYKRQRALLALDKLDAELTREDDELILAESVRLHDLQLDREARASDVRDASAGTSWWRPRAAATTAVSQPTVNGSGAAARTARHAPESSTSPPSVPSRTQRHDAFLKALHPRLSSADLARLVAPATDPHSVPDPLLPPLPASWPTLAGAPPTSTGGPTRGLGIGASYTLAAAPSSSSASAQDDDDDDDDDDDTSTVPDFGTAAPTSGANKEERRGRSPNKRPRGDLRFAPDTTADPPQWREWVAANAASSAAGSESAMSSPILRDMPAPHSPVVDRPGMFSADMKHSLRAHLVTERDRLLAEQAQLRAMIADLRRDVDAPVVAAVEKRAGVDAVAANVEEAAEGGADREHAAWHKWMVDAGLLDEGDRDLVELDHEDVDEDAVDRALAEMIEAETDGDDANADADADADLRRILNDMDTDDDEPSDLDDDDENRESDATVLHHGEPVVAASPLADLAEPVAVTSQARPPLTIAVPRPPVDGEWGEAALQGVDPGPPTTVSFEEDLAEAICATRSAMMAAAAAAAAAAGGGVENVDADEEDGGESGAARVAVVS